MGQISFTISLVLTALFAVAIIGFALDFASNNNAEVNIANDSDISQIKVKIAGNVSSWQGDVDTAKGSFNSLQINERGYTSKTGGEFKVTIFSIAGIA